MLKKLLFLLFLFLESLFGDGFRNCLSEQERAYLDAHTILKHSGNPSYLPYEAFDKKGNHQGMVADYLDVIQKMLEVEIKRVPSLSWEDALSKSRDKKVDMITNYTNDDDFASTHLITKGFIKSPTVIIKQKHDYYEPFISDPSELKGKKIAIGKKYAFLKPVYIEHPQLNYIEVDTIENVLKGVSSGEFDAAIVSLNIGTYNISKHGLRNLQVVGECDFELELGFQVAKEGEILHSILNKALEAISQEEHQAILNKWTKVEVKKELDIRYLIIFLVVIAMGIVLYFFRLYELKKKIKQSTSELSKFLRVFDEHVMATETDLDGNITYASRAFCAISGYTQEELLGKNHRIMKYPENDPKIYKELWETITAGKTWRGVVKNRKKDGGYYWIETVIARDYDAFGKPFGYMAIRHDISAEIELKEFSENLEEIVKSRTEELLVLNKQQQAIFDSASIGIFLLKDRIIKELNNRVCEMVGYSKEELLEGTTRIFCQSDESYDKIADYYKILKEGKIASWEQTLVRKDGTLFLAKISLKAKDESNPTAGAVATIDDITFEKKALEEIKKAKEIAEDATRTKSQFLANVSHEIRTPMSAIMGMSHLALETELDEKQRGYIQKIENASKNLLAIINDILDFSKIEAKKMTLEHKTFYLEEIFENLINLFSFKIKEKNLKILFSIEHDVPSSLIGDSLKLSQILTNLVSNAIKFTSSGEIVVGVKVKELYENSIRLEFWVKDSGIGISDEQIKNLFIPFQQADGSITRTYGGTGLGLSISKHLVQMMDGTIGVESELGKGSRFYFDINIDLSLQNRILLKNTSSKKLLTPSNLHDAVLGAFGKDITKYNKYNDVAKSLHGAKILLVEDNEENQEIAKEFLKKVGVKAVVANNGKEALKIADETPFDAILMDCQMPVMDGYEATRVLRMDRHMTTIPIIAMTANASSEDKEECTRAGMSDFIAKPIDIKLFYNTLIKWIKPKQEMSLESRMAQERGKKPRLHSLNIYGVDIDKALSRVANDENILFAMFKRFASSQREAIDSLQALFEEGKKEELLRAAHTLKSLCGNIEASHLYEIIKKAEELLKQDSFEELNLKEMLLEIKMELKKVIVSIDENFQNSKEEHEEFTEIKLADSLREELSAEIEKLRLYYKNFDSDAITLSQELSQKLYGYLPKQRVDTMLKASLNFDFEEAAAELNKIAQALNISLK